jgi:ankyrin repeat protein
MVKLLLEHKADTEPQTEVGELDSLTALMCAVRGGMEDIVRLLLEAGANPNAPSQPSCDTALHVCPEFRDWPSILALLLDHPADINIQDIEGTTALMVTVRQDCRSPTSFFLSGARMSKSRTRRQTTTPISTRLLVLAPHSISACLRRAAQTSIAGTRMTQRR